MRIFDNFSPLITLLRSVIYQLRIFMVFYMILVYFFALMLGVMEYANYSRREAKAGKRAASVNPGFEYQEIGYLLGNIIAVIRMSLGDF